MAALLVIWPVVPAVAQWKVAPEVQERKLIRRVDPDYPAVARRHHITGAVRLAARIAKDGHVADLRVISGHPLLVKAALKAVNQWQYRPTEIQGRPVEVITTITVYFSGQPRGVPLQIAQDRIARPVRG